MTGCTRWNQGGERQTTVHPCWCKPIQDLQSLTCAAVTAGAAARPASCQRRHRRPNPALPRAAAAASQGCRWMLRTPRMRRPPRPATAAVRCCGSSRPATAPQSWRRRWTPSARRQSAELALCGAVSGTRRPRHWRRRWGGHPRGAARPATAASRLRPARGRARRAGGGLQRNCVIWEQEFSPKFECSVNVRECADMGDSSIMSG